MSNLIRWEPMRDAITLRDAMDRLFDEAFTRPWGMMDLGRGAGAPAVDMYQTDNEDVVTVAVPGMKPQNVHIAVSGDLLTIKGGTREKSEVKEKACHIREQRWGTFERTIGLPAAVVSDKAQA